MQPSASSLHKAPPNKAERERGREGERGRVHRGKIVKLR